MVRKINKATIKSKIEANAREEERRRKENIDRHFEYMLLLFARSYQNIGPENKIEVTLCCTKSYEKDEWRQLTLSALYLDGNHIYSDDYIESVEVVEKFIKCFDDKDFKVEVSEKTKDVEEKGFFSNKKIGEQYIKTYTISWET